MPAWYMPYKKLAFWHIARVVGRRAVFQGYVVSRPFFARLHANKHAFYNLSFHTVCVINNRCLQRNKAQLCWWSVSSWLFPAGVRNKGQETRVSYRPIGLPLTLIGKEETWDLFSGEGVSVLRWRAFSFVLHGAQNSREALNPLLV